MQGSCFWRKLSVFLGPSDLRSKITAFQVANRSCWRNLNIPMSIDWLTKNGGGRRECRWELFSQHAQRASTSLPPPQSVTNFDTRKQSDCRYLLIPSRRPGFEYGSSSDSLASWRRLIEHADQRFSRRQNRSDARHNFLGTDFFAVQGLVGIVICVHGRTL